MGASELTFPGSSMLPFLPSAGHGVVQGCYLSSPHSVPGTFHVLTPHFTGEEMETHGGSVKPIKYRAGIWVETRVPTLTGSAELLDLL